MLADRRSDALVDNFAFQWLRLQSVKEADPDSEHLSQLHAESRAVDDPRNETAYSTASCARIATSWIC